MKLGLKHCNFYVLHIQMILKGNKILSQNVSRIYVSKWFHLHFKGPCEELPCCIQLVA